MDFTNEQGILNFVESEVIKVINYDKEKRRITLKQNEIISNCISSLSNLGDIELSDVGKGVIDNTLTLMKDLYTYYNETLSSNPYAVEDEE